MSTTTTETVMTACPSWCREHWPSDREGNVGPHLVTTKRDRWELDASVYFNHDGTEGGREVRVISIKSDDGFTPERARELARDLIHAADTLDA